MMSVPRFVSICWRLLHPLASEFGKRSSATTEAPEDGASTKKD